MFMLLLLQEKEILLKCNISFSEAFSKDDGWFKERVVNDVEFLNYSDAVKAAMN